MNRLLRIFRPAAHIDRIQDPDVIRKTYTYWRIRLLLTIFSGYAIYYFTRMTFACIMPSLKHSGFNEVQLGWIITTFQISYGISKFGSGILSDRANPRYFMSIGLIITGFLNIAFGLSYSIYLFAALWGLNGLFQAWGSAPCHRILTHWYSVSERGRWWGLWNTSHNLGAAILPIMSAFIIDAWGWRMSMHVPGIMAIITGIFLAVFLRDTPQSLGLPRIEKYRKDIHTPLAEGEEKELSLKERLVTYVLCNKYIWLLSVSYFLVYVIRWAVAQWSFLFLVDVQGFTNRLAAQSLFWFEAGGFFGGLAAGWLSDVAFKGRRGPVNAIFMILIIPAIYTFWLTSEHASTLVGFTRAIMCLLGFFVYGPQMLLAVAAVELSHKKAAATAAGFLGIIAYVGCSMTGGPLGHIIKNFGWHYFFVIITVCSVIGALCILPLWSVDKAPKLE